MGDQPVESLPNKLEIHANKLSVKVWIIIHIIQYNKRWENPWLSSFIAFVAFVLEPMDPISPATMYRIACAKNQSSLAMTTLSFTIRQSLQQKLSDTSVQETPC